MSYAYIIS